MEERRIAETRPVGCRNGPYTRLDLARRSQEPPSPRLQEPLTRLMATVTLLRELLDGSMSYVRVWLRAPYPALDGRTPLSYLLDRQIAPVEHFVRAMAAGQPD
jgi:Antitoxin Xre/MbcA/ParS C-terminal toxin-binding domain